MKINKGFTLIELLVVIAIISLLSSVVMASVNSARAKGADAAIKENLLNVRTQADLIRASSGCYGDNDPPGSSNCAGTSSINFPCVNTIDNTLFKNSNVWSLVEAAAKASGGVENARCASSQGGQAWAVAVKLKTSDGVGSKPDTWCVDSKGQSKSYEFDRRLNVVFSINPFTYACN